MREMGCKKGEKWDQVNLSVDGVRFARLMSGPDARKSVGLGFDHRAEGVVAQGSLLL
ncbi:hypothetical protein XFF6994_3300014 [Xanthomonas citri pv. fuscans]|nr:hypothetical protein XFF6994_3300014 [Xanthomonas citri pv. fuscans]